MDYQVLEQNPCVAYWRLEDADAPVSFEPLREFVEAKLTLGPDTTGGTNVAFYMDMQEDASEFIFRARLFDDAGKTQEHTEYDPDPYYRPYKIEILHGWKWNEQAYRWESKITEFYTNLGRMRGYYVLYQFATEEDNLAEHFVGTLEPRAILLTNLLFTSFEDPGGLAPDTYNYTIVLKDSLGRQDFPYYVRAELDVTGFVTLSFSVVGPGVTFDVYRNCELIVEDVAITDGVAVYTDTGTAPIGGNPPINQDADVGGADAIQIEITYKYPDENENGFIDTPGPSDDVNADRDVQFGDWVPGTVVTITITDPTTGSSIVITEDPFNELPDNDLYSDTPTDEIITEDGTQGEIIGQDDEGNDIVIITNTDPDGNEETVTLIVDDEGNIVSIHEAPEYTVTWIPIETLYNIIDPGVYDLVADGLDYRWDPASTWTDLLDLDGTRSGTAFAILSPTASLNFVSSKARVSIENPWPDVDYREFRVALTVPEKNPYILGGPFYAGARIILDDPAQFGGVYNEDFSLNLGGFRWPFQILFSLFDFVPDTYATGKIAIEFEKREYDFGTVDLETTIELPDWVELPIVDPARNRTTTLVANTHYTYDGVDVGSLTQIETDCFDSVVCDAITTLGLSLIRDTFSSVPPFISGANPTASTQNTIRRPKPPTQEVSTQDIGVTSIRNPSDAGVISI